MPLNDVANGGMFTRTGGDLRSSLGRNAWMTVVIGSECEVPSRSFALRGNVPLSVRWKVTYPWPSCCVSDACSHMDNRGVGIWLNGEWVTSGCEVERLTENYVAREM